MKEFLTKHKDLIKLITNVCFYISVGIMILLFVLVGLGVIKK